MSQGLRASPGRGVRTGPASLKRSVLDPLEVAAEILAARGDAVVVTARDRRVLAANPAAAELFLRPLVDLPGRPMDDLIAPAERQRVAEREHHALGGEAQRYETIIVRGDGAEREVTVVIAPLMRDGQLGARSPRSATSLSKSARWKCSLAQSRGTVTSSNRRPTAS